MNSEKRCWGLRANLRRCGRAGNWRFFCDDHAKQPLIWAISILTFTASIASILGYVSSLSHRDRQSLSREVPLPTDEVSFQYDPAAQHLVGLDSELKELRNRYELSDGTDMNLNRDARQLAEKLIAVDDSNLGTAMEIFKYQSVAYARAIVLETESDSHAKLNSIREILDASDKAQRLIDEVKKPQNYNKHLQEAREWLIKDDAVLRLKRLSAVALCARWQLNKDTSDLTEVRRMFDDVPYDYFLNEKPERSLELKPCLAS